MGLDTSHDCWHGAYSAFSRWRDELARVAGYEFAEYDTDLGKRAFVALDWEAYGAMDGPLMGHWDETPEDPLLILIVHSDCDGMIYHPQLKPLADRLTELLPLLPETDDWGHIGPWRVKTQKFIDGLLDAHEVGEDVEFA